jgi:hypothetical protein
VGAGAFAASVVLAPSLARQGRPGRRANFPQFSWRTVPSAADVGNSARAWNADETRFYSHHFSILSIEKGHGIVPSTPAGERWSEPPFLDQAARLKRSHRPTTVFFYWNALDHYPLYQANATFRPEWHRLPPGCATPLDRPDCFPNHYILDDPALRRWWVDVATGVVADHNVDGIFVDTIATARQHSSPGSAEALMADLRASLDQIHGRRRLILFNIGAAAAFDERGRMDPLLEIADGYYREDFDRPEPTADQTPQTRLRHLSEVPLAAAAGKIVILKGWPRFSFLLPSTATTAYATRVARARADITFPLAAFLCAAERYTYFHYSWGYADNEANPQAPGAGTVLTTTVDSGVVDQQWYPELLRPLGPPRGEAVINGFELSRRFDHARVWCDLASRDATVDWC